VSCTVHVEAPSTAAPLVEPKPGDGAVPAPSLPVRAHHDSQNHAADQPK